VRGTYSVLFESFQDQMLR